MPLVYRCEKNDFLLLFPGYQLLAIFSIIASPTTWFFEMNCLLSEKISKVYREGSVMIPK